MTNQTQPSNVESETNLSSDLQRTVVGSVPAVGSMGVSTTGTGPLNEDALDKMKLAVSEVISETTYMCSRVWEAWQYGTMTDEDFEPAWENDTLLTEVVEAVLAVAQQVVNSVEELDALPFESVVIDASEDQFKFVADGEGGSYWCRFDDMGGYRVTDIELPACVLYRPEVPGA
ncbi:hypothetical protein [Glutamicibacter ardleyensis]|uniref:hypothetical protein n=1 Tax=Glutamicibacter ardleyensis TaxID=225894 RepID=UPI003FD3AABE